LIGSGLCSYKKTPASEGGRYKHPPEWNLTLRSDRSQDRKLRFADSFFYFQDRYVGEKKPSQGVILQNAVPRVIHFVRNGPEMNLRKQAGQRELLFIQHFHFLAR
jgi:hypothetical protein